MDNYTSFKSKKRQYFIFFKHNKPIKIRVMLTDVLKAIIKKLY